MYIEPLAPQVKPLDISTLPVVSEAERDYFRHYGINFEETMENVTHHFGYLSCGRFDIVSHYYYVAGSQGTCFLIHGYFDHSGLYKHLIEYCLKRKLSVVIYDLPGHGLSTGEPASIASFQQYQQVLSEVVDYFQLLATGPFHIIGQSTGGAIAMDYLLTNPRSIFDKVVLLAPLVRPCGWPFYAKLHRILKPLVHSLPRRFNNNSADQDFLDFVKNKDPLQSKRLPLSWVGALKQWEKNFHGLSPCRYAPLIVQGKKDSTVDWQYNIPVIIEKFPRAKVCYLSEGEHHLVNDGAEVREGVLAAIDLMFDAQGH